MLLMDTDTAVADFREYKINGITVVCMPSHEFGGESKLTSPSYLLVLWLVSIWAMITNLIQAISIKTFKRRRDSLGKILWKLGRDKDHISSVFFDRFSRLGPFGQV